MKTIRIQTAKPYDVCIGRGLLNRCGQLLSSVCVGSKAVVVSDDRVAPLYGPTLRASLERAGLQVLEYSFPHGERSKSIPEYVRLLGFLSQQQLSRSDAVVALGGGVTGDLAGFAAATYLRGIRLVQVPTTLLAAVDSSVGGKTGIDLPSGKNQVGCFYQPDLVVCDPDTLGTLPEEVLSDGFGEVVKYVMLGNPALYQLLLEQPREDTLESVIAACVAQKRDLVAADERDHGSRQLLNLGHSFGHAMEACSRYTLSHGKAVAMGLALVTRAAKAKGLCPPGTLDDLLALLERCGLPSHCPYPGDMLLGAMLADKKISGNHINLVVPRGLGRCDIMPVPVTELSDWLAAGGAL